ncbi:hypothetical protein T484DRAFT_1766460, partial [Baffinella frigidus]
AADEAQLLAGISAKLAAAALAKAEAMRTKAALCTIKPELAEVAAQAAEREQQLSMEAAAAAELAEVAAQAAEREQQLSTEASAAAVKAVASSEEAREFARTAKFHQVGAGNAMIFASGNRAPRINTAHQADLPEAAADDESALDGLEEAARAMSARASRARGAAARVGTGGAALAAQASAAAGAVQKWADSHGRVVTRQNAHWTTTDTTGDYPLQKKWENGGMWWKAPA